MSNGLGGDALQEYSLYDLDLGSKVTQNVARYPLHHVTYAAIKFEVATSNGLGGEMKIHYLTFDRHRKCCPVPSTSCDLYSCKV